MTDLPKEQRSNYTGQKIGEKIEQLSKKSKEEILEFFTDIDKMTEDADKEADMEHQLWLAAAAKEVRFLLSLNYQTSPTTSVSSPSNCATDPAFRTFRRKTVQTPVHIPVLTPTKSRS